MAWRPKCGGFDPAEKILPEIYPQTDYDYALPNLSVYHKALSDDMYTQIPLEQSTYKWSDGIDSLWTKRYIDSEDYQGMKTIQIILRNDFTEFCNTWDKIKPQFWYKYLWKRSPNKPPRDMRFDVMEQLIEIEKSW